MNRLTSFFLIAFAGNIFAFSGAIATDTTWSTNVILTGNVTVNAGATLTIDNDVKVQAVWVDNNADLIGDILFTVNGKLAPAGTATFESYDRKNSRQSWMGLVLSGPKQTVNGLVIKNAWRGLTITTASDSNMVSNTAIDSCIDGLYVDAVNDSTILKSFAIRNCRYGIRVYSSTGINADDIDVNHNDSGGVLLTSTNALFSNAVVYSNVMYGIKTAGSNKILTLTKSTITGNSGYGLFVDTAAIANVTLCNIVNNTKPGILVTSNTANAMNVSASNIYGNAATLIAKEDLVKVDRLGLTISTGGGWVFKLPIFTSRFDAWHDANYFSVSLTIGSWSSSIGQYEGSRSYVLTPPLSADSITCPSGYGTGISAYGFTHPHQLLYLTATRNIITASDNWWGQFTGIDTLIGVQTLVTWSGYRTGAVAGAGSTNSTQRITVSKLSQAFPNTAIMFADSTKLTITNTGGSILRLDSVGCPDTCFKIRHQKSSISSGDVDSVTITFKPATAKAYTAYLNIASNDPTNPIVQVLLTGTGVAYNYRPRFTAKPADTQCIAGDPFARTLKALDSNITDTLTYSLLKNPTGMTIAPLTGVISWTPALTATTDSVIVKVADPLGLTDTCRFKLTVAHRPVFTTAAPNDTLISVGSTWDFDINATDADGPTMVWSLDQLVGDMMISQASGLLHFVPKIGDTGRHQVVVRVTDSLGAYAVQSFYIRVINGPVSTMPGKSLVLPKTFGITSVTSSRGMALRMAVPANSGSGQYVEIRLTDVRGRTIANLSGTYSAGWHVLNFGDAYSKQLLLLNVKTTRYSKVLPFVTK